MNLPEEKRMLLSQLVDGELPADQANRVLAEVLDELVPLPAGAAAAREFDALVRLRRATEPWREQEPPRMVVAVAAEKSAGVASHAGWRAVSLASAVLLGGILVAGGYYLGGRSGIEPPRPPMVQQPVVVVTPEQRSEIARTFALHESVAGPLSWYAADDATIQVAPARTGEGTRPPVAIVLRLTRDLSCPSRDPIGPKTYVIVCRDPRRGH